MRTKEKYIPFTCASIGGGWISMNENRTKLEKILEDRGMSQKDLCDLCGKSSGTVSSWVRGEKKPTSKNLKLIAEKLEVTIEDISEIINENETFIPVKKLKRCELNRNLVRKKILELGLTQKKFSSMVDITEPMMSNYLTGKTFPTYNIIYRMANALGCEVTDIILVQKNEKVDDVPNHKPTGREVNIETKHLPIENNVDHLDKFVEFPPSVVRECTKCMFDMEVKIQINTNMSYTAEAIHKWARWSMCHLTDKLSSDYDPIQAEMISDMFFRFFVNKKKPLREDCMYFVREKHGELFLKRDRGDMSTQHEYVITHSDETGRYVTRKIMTESERRKLEDILNDLNISYKLRDVADILK